jgi:hypothetical protein
MTFGILLTVATANSMTVTPIGTYSSLAVAEAEKALLDARLDAATKPDTPADAVVPPAFCYFTACVRKT